MNAELVTQDDNTIEKSNGTHNPEGRLEKSESTRCWASAATDVFEGPDDYLVLANVPGVNKEDIDVQYVDGELRLEARRASDAYEPRPIDYRRTFEVGRNVNVEAITAELKNGLLEVHLPKLESARPRQIAVQTA